LDFDAFLPDGRITDIVQDKLLELINLGRTQVFKDHDPFSDIVFAMMGSVIDCVRYCPEREFNKVIILLGKEDPM